MAKKSKKAKRGAPARKKKGMKKAKRAKRAKSKKRAPKPAPAPTTEPPQPAPVPPTLAGMALDLPAFRKAIPLGLLHDRKTAVTDVRRLLTDFIDTADAYSDGLSEEILDRPPPAH